MVTASEWEMFPAAEYNKNKDSSEENYKVVEETKKMFNGKDFPPTVVPAIRLHVFNFLKKNPRASSNDVSIEVNRLKHYLDLETETVKEGNPLPTIGLEIEIPEELFPAEFEGGAVLNSLGINTEMEVSQIGPEKFIEIQTAFSYSGWVQSRMMQELVEMNVIPVENDEGGRHIEPGLLSMHCNFGIPPGLIQKGGPEEKICKRITDLLTFAYVSPERIAQRKTRKASLSKRKDIQKTEKMQTGEGAHSNKMPLRFEIRTTEFVGQSSYRMLTEAQVLVGLVIAHLKREKNLEISVTEERFADLFSEFYEKITTLLETKTKKVHLFDSDVIKSLGIMEDKEFIATCRNMITKYAQLGLQAIDEIKE